MTTEIKVPVFAESISEGQVLTWHKQPGDSVMQGDVLVEIETDKVVLEVPALASGVIDAIDVAEGETVTSEQLLGTIDETKTVTSSAKESAKEAPVDEPAQAAQTAQSTQAEVPATTATETATSPSARALLREHGLQANEVQTTGRIGKADVESFVKDGGSVPQELALDADMRPQKRVPMTRIRAKIADHLLGATQNTAMLTTFNEVNMQPVMDARTQYKDAFLATHHTKLGFMSFFVRAATEGLKRFPAVNASIDGNDIIYHGFCDIGVAVSTERGLLVPIIRDTQSKSMADIEATIIDFGKRAGDGKIDLDELQGGTFSVTNGGIFGSMMSTPILNPPQSAILGMHGIQKRAVVINDEICIRPMMYLALSYDHRIIDGKDAVSFLRTIKEFLEDPIRMVLEV